MMTIGKLDIVGHVSLTRLFRGNASCSGETRWHQSFWSEFGLWGCSLHGFGLRFEVIGPFKLRRKGIWQ